MPCCMNKPDSIYDVSKTIFPFDTENKGDFLANEKFKTARVNAIVYGIIGLIGLIVSFAFIPLPVNYFVSAIAFFLGVITSLLFKFNFKRLAIHFFNFGFAFEVFLIAFFTGGLYSFIIASFLTLLVISSILLEKRDLIIYFVMTVLVLSILSALSYTKQINRIPTFYVPVELYYMYLMITISYLFSFLLVNLNNITSLINRLRLGEYYSKILLEHGPDSILIMNRKGIIVNVNSNFVKLFKKENRSDLIGKHFSVIVNESDFPEIDIYQETLIKSGHASINLKIKDGKRDIFINVRGNVFENGKSIHIVQDITKEINQKEMETRIHNLEKESSKTEVINKLTGSIAHDFNNLMAKIISFSDLTQLQVKSKSSPDEIKESLEKINEVAQRGSTLTRRLMTFSKRSISNPKIYDVISELNKQRDNLQLMVSPVQLNLTLIPETAFIRIDLDDLDQVLINLLTNAKHASNITDTIMIEVTKVKKSFGEGFLSKENEENKSNYVCIAIKDTGSGILVKPEQLFNSFYSTKSYGTGLGLSIIQSILELYDAKISIKSSNEGSIFETYWPEKVPQENIEKEVSSQSVSLPIMSILMVDDEISIIENISSILKAEGQAVEIAQNGEEAIKKLKTQDFDIVITDIVMSKMNGIELLNWIQCNRPYQKFILITGFSDFQKTEFKTELNISGLVLMKPFTIRDLKLKIKEIIE